MKKSFIEWVSLGAREPVYSAALAWFFSPDSKLPLRERLAVIQAISGLRTSKATAISVLTEWNKVDLRLELQFDSGTRYVAIENKIKATESKGQLARYDDALKTLTPAPRKIFLTLLGELPSSGRGWKPVSYSALCRALRRQPRSGKNIYVHGLCLAMTQLVTVAEGAVKDEALAAGAFNDQRSDESGEFTSYLEAMRLRGIVQRLWMSELSRRLRVRRPWLVKVGETNGQAFWEVKAALKSRRGYVVGLQVQHRAIKAFCAPDPYPLKASKAQDRGVAKTIAAMPEKLGVKRAPKISRSRGRGFRSFTVRQLPEGRNLDEWARRVQPYVRRLQSVYGDVTAPNGD